ncbi:hypothetical protein evm_012504 [Chilo suppressalis]|nr:hypothetical protein evm_012504 [Chilo suppressalis]
MEGYNYAKNVVLTFKLASCCWLAPVKIGILAIAYVNILISLISLVGVANGSYSPTILKVQEVILEDFASKPIPILSYATELAFNVILLCAVYRKDLELLRVFTWYCVSAIIASALLYSIVLAVIDVLTVILIVTSIIFQIYLLLLVRSIMVELKELTDQNGAPKQVLSTISKDEDNQAKSEDEANIDIPLTPEAVQEEHTSLERDTTLATVEEHLNEVTVEVRS